MYFPISAHFYPPPPPPITSYNGKGSIISLHTQGPTIISCRKLPASPSVLQADPQAVSGECGLPEVPGEAGQRPGAQGGTGVFSETEEGRESQGDKETGGWYPPVLLPGYCNREAPKVMNDIIITSSRHHCGMMKVRSGLKSLKNNLALFPAASIIFSSPRSMEPISCKRTAISLHTYPYY